MNIIDSDLLAIQEIRICLEEAVRAKEELIHWNESRRTEVVRSVVRELQDALPDYAKQAQLASDFGCWEDEAWILKQMTERTEELLAVPTFGEGLQAGVCGQADSIGVSKGVIAYFAPPWLSVAATWQTVLLAIQTGCPLIVSPHHRCQKVVQDLVGKMAAVAVHHGYPKEAVLCLSVLSQPGEDVLAAHPEVAMTIHASRRRREAVPGTDSEFRGTIGNNPVFIEKTADLRQACERIVTGKAFYHGLLPGVEQSIVVESGVDGSMRSELKRHGAYFLTDEQAAELERVLFDETGAPRTATLGKSALDLAQRAGLLIPADTKVLVVEKPYVSKKSPYSCEKFWPVLSYYVEDDWMHACEKCIELILNERIGHTLTIHSQDPSVIEQFILRKPVARVLVNASSAFGAMGISTNLPLSVCLADADHGANGSGNLNREHFLRRRLVAHTENKSAPQQRPRTAGPNDAVESNDAWFRELVHNAEQEFSG